MNRVRIIQNDRDRERAVADLPTKYPYAVKVYSANIRSHAQNRLMWMWLTEISSKLRESGELDYGPQVWHEWFKQSLLPMQEVDGPDGTMWASPSTTRLTTKEMTDYLERMEMLAAEEYGVVLPRPDDLYWTALGVER